MRDVVENIQTCHALGREALGRERLRLLHEGGEHVAHVGFVLAGALDVEHRRLQQAAEADGLLGRLARAVGHAVDLFLEVDGQSLDQRIDVNPGPVKDPPAHGVVGDREQDVLGGEMSVAPVLGSLRRDHKDPFESWGEHDPLMMPQVCLQPES